jgi:hypothetical protein
MEKTNPSKTELRQQAEEKLIKSKKKTGQRHRNCLEHQSGRI